LNGGSEREETSDGEEGGKNQSDGEQGSSARRRDDFGREVFSQD
jgi:hypothetical protein